MIKLPEPVASRIWCPCEQNEFQYNEEGDGAPLFTETQLKQAVRDALNEALSVVVCRSGIKPDPMWVCEGIRALIKEIE